jgi:hypothetical protein
VQEALAFQKDLIDRLRKGEDPDKIGELFQKKQGTRCLWESPNDQQEK